MSLNPALQPWDYDRIFGQLLLFPRFIKQTLTIHTCRSLTKSLLAIKVIFSVLARRTERGTLPWSRMWGGDLPSGVFADKNPGLPCGKCSTTKSRLWHFPSSCLPLLLWFQQGWQVFPLLRAKLFVELLFLNRTAQMSSVDTQLCAIGEGNGIITFLFACVASTNVKET